MTKSQTTSQTFTKYTVPLADLKGIGAATSGTIILDTLPAGTIVTHVLMKPTTALAGPSVTAATARVVTTAVGSGTAVLNFGTAYDVFQATGAGVRDFDGASQFIGTTADAELRLKVTSTGANLSVLTAGQIDVYVETLNVL